MFILSAILVRKPIMTASDYVEKFKKQDHSAPENAKCNRLQEPDSEKG